MSFLVSLKNISTLDVRSREFHVLMVQGLLLKESKLPSPSKGIAVVTVRQGRLTYVLGKPIIRIVLILKTEENFRGRIKFAI